MTRLASRSLCEQHHEPSLETIVCVGARDGAYHRDRDAGISPIQGQQRVLDPRLADEETCFRSSSSEVGRRREAFVTVNIINLFQESTAHYIDLKSV